jgi:hypothetical protein
MNHDPRTAPLRKWNDLAREKTENAVVSSMFEAALQASAPIETFSTWLLVATAAVASFQIANAEKLLPLITRSGFVICGAFLFVSCIFGLFSKVFSVRCQIGIETGNAARKTFAEHLAKYKAEEQQIQKEADFWGIDLRSGIRTERVMDELLQPFPCWVRWSTRHYLKKHAGKPQIAYISQMRSLYVQGVAALLQSLCFAGFLGTGMIFAAAS